MRNLNNKFETYKVKLYIKYNTLQQKLEKYSSPQKEY